MAAKKGFNSTIVVYVLAGAAALWAWSRWGHALTAHAATSGGGSSVPNSNYGYQPSDYYAQQQTQPSLLSQLLNALTGGKSGKSSGGGSGSGNNPNASNANQAAKASPTSAYGNTGSAQDILNSIIEGFDQTPGNSGQLLYDAPTGTAQTNEYLTGPVDNTVGDLNFLAVDAPSAMSNYFSKKKLMIICSAWSMPW